MGRRALLVLVVLARSVTAVADEGFWPLDHVPRQLVKDRYGVDLDDALLGRIARAAIQVGSDSAAWASPQGLVFTKHGTVKGCLHALRELRRTAGPLSRWCSHQPLRQALPLYDRLVCRPLDRAGEYDYLEHGYLARTAADELRCPGYTVGELIEVTDVTARMQAAGGDDARALVRGAIEAECRQRPGEDCRVVALHGGSRFERHRARIHTDVRLVFAPERQVADFGDLQDQITFPDHDFKTAFVRVYEGGRPLATPHFLPFSTRLPAEGELTLMVGHPPATGRYALATALERRRDRTVAMLTVELEQRGVLTEIAAARPILAPGFDFDDKNWSVVYGESRRRGLSDELIARRAADERALIASLERIDDPELGEIKGAYARAAQAHAAYADDRDRALALMTLGWSEMFVLANAALHVDRPWARAALRHPRAVDEKVEISRLALVMRKLQAVYPARDPFLRKVLGDESVRERATALVHGSRLTDPAFRERLAARGATAVTAAHDPIIELVRLMIPEVDAALGVYDKADDLGDHAADLLAAARYRLEGDAVFPEATGTVRLSFGALRGFLDGGKPVAPVTTLGDLFDLSRGRGPYHLPATWLAARGALALATPLNVATDHDTIPPAILLDARGDLIGMAFMGNRPSATYETFDTARTRVVSVHNAAVVEILRHVYHATRLLAELGVPQ